VRHPAHDPFQEVTLVKRVLSTAVALATALALSGGVVLASTDAGQGSGQSDLAAVRAATARYHDVDAAIADGYVRVSDCVSAPGLGAMGIHYLNPSLARDLESTATQPELLLYAPGDHGQLRLVGVEYFQPALVLTPDGPAPWFEQTPPPYDFLNPAPSILGHTFDGPMAGHDPTMPWHYDLHVWIWHPNPSGMFSEFNPTLSC
jgi:hypothetical protein